MWSDFFGRVCCAGDVMLEPETIVEKNIDAHTHDDRNPHPNEKRVPHTFFSHVFDVGDVIWRCTSDFPPATPKFNGFTWPRLPHRGTVK